MFEYPLNILVVMAGFAVAFAALTTIRIDDKELTKMGIALILLALCGGLGLVGLAYLDAMVLRGK